MLDYAQNLEARFICARLNKLFGETATNRFQDACIGATENSAKQSAMENPGQRLWDESEDKTAKRYRGSPKERKKRDERASRHLLLKPDVAYSPKNISRRANYIIISIPSPVLLLTRRILPRTRFCNPVLTSL
jgi:hypothetical protein